MNIKNLCHILTLLPSYFFPCRTEPQNSPMVPAQDGPSEKLSQHLATEALGTNSWERDKACRELSPARAHRWDTAPSPFNSSSSSWGCRNEICFSGHSSPLSFADPSFRPLNQIKSQQCFSVQGQIANISGLWARWSLSKLLNLPF